MDDRPHSAPRPLAGIEHEARRTMVERRSIAEQVNGLPLKATMDINHVFRYHAPTPDQIPKYEELREFAKMLADAIIRLTPACADQSAALRHVREAVMTANASIALGGRL